MPTAPRSPRLLLAAAAALLLATTLLACGREGSSPAPTPTVTVERDAEAPHPLLGEAQEVVLGDPGASEGDLAARLDAMRDAAQGAENLAAITVDYPLDGSIFPPEFVPPTFLWHDDAATDTWLVRVTFEEGPPIEAVVPYAQRPKGHVDPRAFGETNERYLGTDYQNSAVAWTPSKPLWEELKKRSVETPATITFTGFASEAPAQPLARGAVAITTSRDPVGAPIFYRDVPLMPNEDESGKIQPLSRGLSYLIGWRLKDVSRDDSKLVLSGMASCGNCHSFSLDGKTLGMDVDGPQGDKGTYAIKDLTPQTVIDYDDIITWNSFPDKPQGHKTIGFLSRISPDGRYVLSTVNESLYVQNFTNYRYLQVFFPTRGILAYYSRAAREMKALRGADDPKYVHCSPVWSPDGKWIVFARAEAFDPWVEGQQRARYPNDPNEPEIRYELYRMPFNEGRGGKPEPVVGASNNGMSNTFPKISPDGKWIVFVKCKNGQLMRPDGRLWMVPLEGGEAREMRCNTDNMNSWHSFSPNGRWMVFSSKTNTPYTQAFLTHIDEDGNDSPAILVPNCTAENRAVNLPEFLNAPYDALDSIEVPAVRHHEQLWEGTLALNQKDFPKAIEHLQAALEDDPDFSSARVTLGRALAALGQWDEAIKQFEIAQDANPTDFSANLQLGMALMETLRPDKAVIPLKRALQIIPHHEDARRALLQAYHDLGRLDEAAVHARQLLTTIPDDGDLERFLAGLLFRMGRGREGIHHLARAVELLPDNQKIATTYAWHLATHPDDEVRNGRLAVEVAERVAKATSGKRPEPLDALAAALAEVGSFGDAARVEEQAIRLAREKTPTAVPDMQERLALYRSRKPYRAPPEN